MACEDALFPSLSHSHSIHLLQTMLYNSQFRCNVFGDWRDNLRVDLYYAPVTTYPSAHEALKDFISSMFSVL